MHNSDMVQTSQECHHGSICTAVMTAHLFVYVVRAIGRSAIG